MRAITTLLLILIQDSGGRGQELEGLGQEDMGRRPGGEGRSRSVLIQIEDTAKQPYNCTAFLDTLEVRKIQFELGNSVYSILNSFQGILYT